MERFYLFPFPALSVNDAYFQPRGRSRRILSTNGRSFKEKVKNIVDFYESNFYNKIKIEGNYFTCKYSFFFEEEVFFTKVYSEDSFTLAAKDVSNYFKLAEDAIFSTLGIDDKFVFNISGEKFCSKFYFSNTSLEGKSFFTVEIISHEKPPFSFITPQTYSNILNHYDSISSIGC